MVPIERHVICATSDGDLVMAKYLVVFCVAMLLSQVILACGPVADHAVPTRTIARELDAHSITVGDVTLTRIMARPSPLSDGNSAVYFVIGNGGDSALHLLQVDSPAATAVQLHESLNDNGVMRMEHRPEGFVIAAGEQLTLKPGGKHVMLMGLFETLEPGDRISVTLSFTGLDPISLSVPVMEIGGGDTHK